MKIIKKSITAEKFLEVVEKFKCPKPLLENIKSLDNGHCLARIVNQDKNITTDYFLKKFFIRKFSLQYSCNAKVKHGKELLISSLDISKINLCQTKNTKN